MVEAASLVLRIGITDDECFFVNQQAQYCSARDCSSSAGHNKARQLRIAIWWPPWRHKPCMQLVLTVWRPKFTRFWNLNLFFVCL